MAEQKRQAMRAQRKCCEQKEGERQVAAHVAELVQHLLAVFQIRGHELGRVHFHLFHHFPGGQARLAEGKMQVTNANARRSRALLSFKINMQEGTFGFAQRFF